MLQNPRNEIFDTNEAELKILARDINKRVIPTFDKHMKNNE